MRLRPGTSTKLGPGQRFDIGEDTFEVRERPTSLTWHPPAKGAQRSKLLFTLSAVSMTALLMWRLATLLPSGSAVLVAISISIGLVALVVYGLRRIRGRFLRADGAFLALVLESLSREHTDVKEAQQLPLWVSRPGVRTAKVVIAGALDDEKLAGLHCRHPGFAGCEASSSARWLAAQIAVALRGATVTCEDGSIWTLAGGGSPIHLCSHEKCLACPNGRISSQAVHIAVSATFESLPTWCDFALTAHRRTVSPLWWWQVASRYEPTDRIAEHVYLEDLQGHQMNVQAGIDREDCLAAIVGINEDGPLIVDLVRDGPHALVAGCTGSGKSEALTTWLLSMCQSYSPQSLRLVLIDYKGGAAFNRFSGLAHVEAVLTDLDPTATDRALKGIGALLSRRETLLMELGFQDLGAWQRARVENPSLAAPPPRILIVIDEFRLLADTHPEALDTLLRLAAQGRSLGLHLIAATQRPAGAITASMRANMELRVALRCLSDADSIDMVADSSAAQLPKIPGRAIIADHGEIQFALVKDPQRLIEDLKAESDQYTKACQQLWPARIGQDLSWLDLDAWGWQEQLQDKRIDTCGEAGIRLGLIDGIEEGHHRVWLWDGAWIRISTPDYETTQAGLWVSAIAQRIALAKRLSLHHCSWSPNPESVSQIVPTASADIIRLFSHAGQHGPSVIALDHVDSTLDAVAAKIGHPRCERLWASFLDDARNAGIVLVCATPGRFGSQGWRIPASTELLRPDCLESAWRAGLSGTTTVLRGRHELLLKQTADDGGKVVAVPTTLDADLNGAQSRQGNENWHVATWTGATKGRRGDIGSHEDGSAGIQVLVGDHWAEWTPDGPSPWVIISDEPSACESMLRRTGQILEWPPFESIQILPSSAWPRFERWSSARVLALDPSSDVVRSLTQNARNSPFSLLAEQWDESSGVLVDRGWADRIRFA
ncbi:FtsK/SpoIIIE domain-containing protein [Schaalia vaccimaxillae]|uniref:FtsK/SpoIIIE domain-containing protein n=1 Tax=Schaalia vaccimaxillae TaxID=183916 RepID=UPI0013F4BCC2|nr:FtsK/SpoIIIE domain-containing protein [Schaalia vaccimaxillae]